MEFAQGGGEGKTQNQSFFGIDFGSSEIKILERSWAIYKYIFYLVKWGGGNEGGGLPQPPQTFIKPAD